MPSKHLIFCCPLLLPSIFLNIMVFSNVLHIRWPKYWSFSFSISPSKEFSELISSRIDWIDLLAVQGTFKCFIQHLIQKHNFFGDQPSLWSNSHLHTWLLKKIIVFTIWNYISKVMSLIFNIVSRFVITFLPRSTRLNFMAAITICSDFGSKKIKSVTVSIVSLSICHEVMEPDSMTIGFECWVLNQLFHSSLLPSSRGFFSSSFLSLGWCHLHIWDYWYFSW